MRHIIYYLAIILVFLTGCTEDYFKFDQYSDITYSPDLAIHLGFASYSIEELIAETDSLIEFSEGEGGLVILTFSDSLEKILIRDEITLADQSFAGDLDLGIGLPLTLPPGQSLVILNDSISHEFDPEDGAEIDSVGLRNGTLSINLESLMPADVIMTFAFYSISLNEEPLIVSIPVNYQGGGTQTESVDIDLSGYKMDLTDSGTTVNSFTFGTRIEITSVGATLTPQDHLNYEIIIEKIQYEYISGYLGNRMVELEEQELEFNFFEDFVEGEIKFADPEITMNIFTNAGILAALDFTEFKAVDKNGDSLELSGSIMEDPFIIRGPGYENPNQVVTSTLQINNDNSNIVDLLAFQPTSIKINGSMTTNPDSEPKQKNFITYDSELSGDFQFSLPLDLLIAGLHVSENLNVNNIDLGDFDEVYVKIRSENDIPFGGQIQAIFYDSDGMELFRLFDQHQTLISAAEVDQDGFSMETALDSLYIELKDEKIQLFEQADSVNLDIILDTYNSRSGEYVKIAMQNKLRVDLGILAGTNLKFDLN